jgi:cell pole-organizing protein PopZ
MTQSAKVQQPSMEEILTSIRRIIADDDADKAAKTPERAGTKLPPMAAVTGEAAPAARSSTLSPAPLPPAAASSQNDTGAMQANLDAANTALRSDVLNLTEGIAAPAPAAEPEPKAVFPAIDVSSDVVSTDRSAKVPIETAVQGFKKTREPFPRAATPDHGLISSSTLAAVDSAFNSLANTVIGQNARTLEDLVKEMLRPLLKSWLDDNLPGLVDRIVRAEIERVSRGRL